jgi:lysophospholipase L1-like esterase
MTYGLPSRGEVDWDTKLNASIEAVKATADAAQTPAGLDAAVAADIADDTPSATRTALNGGWASRTSVPAESLRGWGHSYMAGVSAATGASFLEVAADRLGLPMRNEGIGGTSLYSHVGGGSSWPTVMQKTTRPRRFASAGGLHVVMYGINDVNELGNTAAYLEVFKWSLRSVISRLRAGAIFEDTDSSVVKGGAGAWATNADTTCNSGAGYSYNATAGATVTITTPADFPGGTVAIGYIGWSDGGCDVAVTLNGSAAGSFTTKDANKPAGKRVPQVYRVPNVPAGVNTLVCTSSAHTGSVGGVFDYWQWEPATTDAPLVVLVKQPKPIDYAGYGAGGVNGPPTDAGVDVLNAIHDSVAAEFDSRVVVVDTASMDKSAAYFVAGNVHPNTLGHRVLGEMVTDAVRDAAVTSYVPRPRTLTPRVEYGTTVPSGAATNWNVGDRVINTAPVESGPPGWVCTVAGAPGTWVAEADLGTDRRIFSGTAAPTTGTWSAGDVVFTTAPAAGYVIGWACITGGSPGTWRELSAYVRMGGGDATLVAGVVDVAYAATTTSTRIRLWQATAQGTPGAHFIASKTAGVGFRIQSTSATDTSVIAWEVLNN